MYLVNSAGDEAVHFLLPEEMRERSTEAGSRLDGWEGDLADVGRLVKTKYLLRLVEVHTFLESLRIKSVTTNHKI